MRNFLKKFTSYPLEKRKKIAFRISFVFWLVIFVVWSISSIYGGEFSSFKHVISDSHKAFKESETLNGFGDFIQAIVQLVPKNN